MKAREGVMPGCIIRCPHQRSARLPDEEEAMKDLLDVIKVEGEETSGRVVRAFRRNFNLTLADIEHLTGIPSSNLSAIENDKLEIGVRRARLLAAVYGISPALLLFPSASAEEKRFRQIRKAAAKLIEKKRRSGG